MSVEIFSYFSRLYTHEWGIAQIVLLFSVGLFAVWIVRKLTPPRRRLGAIATIVLGLSSTMCGLVLTTTTYTCHDCVPPTPGCKVVAVGIPFRQQLKDRGPAPVRQDDACTLSSEESRPALVANFSLGVLMLPVSVLLFRTRPSKGVTPEK
jgi:uncharacterized membrane protein YeaQ/YmgE (transglycosylase-associated protein family)